MKALLVNPELPPFFWSMKETMKLAGAETLSPPLGLLTAAALLPQEWDLRLVDLCTRELREEDWHWADLVMITGMLPHRDSLLSVLREASRRGKTTVVGGPYATSCPDELLEAGANFLIMGEGEETIPLFLDALRDGGKGGVFERAAKPDLTASPIPRFDLLNINDYVIMGVQTSRGCPFDCEFCNIVSLYGRKQRYKAPDQVIAELEALFEVGWRGEVFISDDNFIGSKVHAKAILDKLIPWVQSRGYPFSFVTQVSVNLGQDLAMIDLMTEANFSLVFIGVESPDEEVLAANQKYQNIRNPLRESLDNMNRNGLNYMASFVIGFDGEKQGTGQRICEFVEECAIPIVQLATLFPLPGTRLWERLKKEGRLLRETPGEWALYGTLHYVPSRPASEILEEYAAAWERLYDRSRFLDRVYRFYTSMRPTRRALALRAGTPPADAGVPQASVPFRRKIYDLLGFFRLVWWYGIKPRSRGQFWRQLLGMRRNNPSRLIRFLGTCAFGESLIRMTPEVRKRTVLLSESPRDGSESPLSPTEPAKRKIAGE